MSSNFLQAAALELFSTKIKTAVAGEPADRAAMKTALDAIYNEQSFKSSILEQALRYYQANTLVSTGGKLTGSITVTDGGTGYSVGEIMPVAGATSGYGGAIVVTAVSSGVITACSIWNVGDNYVGALTIDTSGAGNGDAVLAMASSATYEDATLVNDYITVSTNAGIAESVAVNAGGTGYTVNDVLTVTTASGTGLTVKVDTVATGVVTAVSIVTPGSGMSSNTTAGAVTGGTGNDDCTIDVTAYLV